MFRIPASYGASTLVLCCALSGASSSASAQTPGAMLPTITVEAPARKQVQRSAKKPRRQAAAARPRVMIRTAAGNPPSPAGGSNAAYAPPPVKQRFQLPQESHSITAKQIEETISLKDAEDAVKYMPSLFVRKRNDGDNQAVLATRSWGLNSSARTL